MCPIVPYCVQNDTIKAHEFTAPGTVCSKQFSLYVKPIKVSMTEFYGDGRKSFNQLQGKIFLSLSSKSLTGKCKWTIITVTLPFIYYFKQLSLQVLH